MTCQEFTTMSRVIRLFAVAVAVALGAAACTVKETEAPPLAGPSVLGLSLSMTASPDTLPRDGASQSSVQVSALGPDGRAARGVSLRMEIVLDDVVQDFGTLSSRTVVTGDDGVARLTYTAPPRSADPTDPGSVIRIRATPISTDAQGTTPREIALRLTPSGVILPPGGAPVPAFIWSPSNVTLGVEVIFDATDTTDEGQPCGACSYAWSMGDGTSKTGQIVRHAFSAPGTFTVRLTVTDPTGRLASTSQAVGVGSATLPTAAFTYSPTAPGVSQDIFFTAAASTAAPGRRIAFYEWDFGSGRTAEGVTAVKRYDTAGTYIVTLKVTDDIGSSSTATQSVSVATSPTSGILASLTFSPTAPKAGQSIQFNASGSRGEQGAQVAEYRFNFGVPGVPEVVGTSPIVAYTYATQGSYLVTLTIRDSSGKTATTTVPVSIAAP
jgi:PKD repeat protein